MGIVKIVATLPVQLKAIVVLVLFLVGTWMVITPIYLEILSWTNSVPVWFWMIVGVAFIIVAAKFGKVIL